MVNNNVDIFVPPQGRDWQHRTCHYCLVLSAGSKRWVLSLNTVSEGLSNIVLLDSERQTAGPEWRKAHLVKGGDSYTYTRITDVGFAADVKGVILLQEWRRRGRLPFWGHRSRHRDRNACPVLRRTYGCLPVAWPVLIFHPTGGRGLSWHEWLVHTKTVHPLTVTHLTTNGARWSNLVVTTNAVTSESNRHTDENVSKLNKLCSTCCIGQVVEERRSVQGVTEANDRPVKCDDK